MRASATRLIIKLICFFVYCKCVCEKHTRARALSPFLTLLFIVLNSWSHYYSKEIKKWIQLYDHTSAHTHTAIPWKWIFCCCCCCCSENSLLFIKVFLTCTVTSSRSLSFFLSFSLSLCLFDLYDNIVVRLFVYSHHAYSSSALPSLFMSLHQFTNFFLIFDRYGKGKCSWRLCARERSVLCMTVIQHVSTVQ